MAVRRGVRRVGFFAVLGTLAMVVGPILGGLGSAGAADQTDTYSCTGTGTPVAWTVPAGVTSVTIQAFGAQGGDVNGDDGGLGGSVAATMPVTPGDVLYLLAGCAGADASVPSNRAGASGSPVPGGGGPGGVPVGDNGVNGAAGGGASIVMRNGTSAMDVVVVAGGGGGASVGGGGGAGSGNEPAVRGGDGDTSTAGEGGGTAGCSNGNSGAGTGNPSPSDDGGPCASFPSPGGAGGFHTGNFAGGGGGGGGGWQSGGGGGGVECYLPGECGDDAPSGGGGGSGIVKSPAVSTASTPVGECTAVACASAIGANAGNGRILITYTLTAAAAVQTVIRFTG